MITFVRLRLFGRLKEGIAFFIVPCINRSLKFWKLSQFMQTYFTILSNECRHILSVGMAFHILHQYLSITSICHNAYPVGTSGTRCCRYDNLRYRRRGQSWHHGFQCLSMWGLMTMLVTLLSKCQFNFNSISLLPYKIHEHIICKHDMIINACTHHNSAYKTSNEVLHLAHIIVQTNELCHLSAFSK